MTTDSPTLSELKISPYALFVLYHLQAAGHQAYVVGGAVRDLLLGATTSDYDFTTEAQPEQLLEILPESYYENTFGTVSLTPQHLAELVAQKVGVPLTVLPAFPRPVTATTRPKIIDQAQATKVHVSLQKPEKSTGQASEAVETDPRFTAKGVEITTFRSDGVYTDYRRPDQVTWGHTLEEDLARRDFTINALAISIDQAILEKFFNDLKSVGHWPEMVTLDHSEFTVHDYHQGLNDLAAFTLRTVGEPAQRFREDALRMLRAIRFAVQLNFKIDDVTFEAIATQAHLLEYVSGERVKEELWKMLASPFPAEAIELLDQTNLLQYILPELLEGKGVMQGGHHTTDVWVHALDALRHCPSPDPLVRFATLIHDIGKPRTFHQSGGSITFYNHEIVGAKMAKTIGYRLKLSRKELDKLYVLVRQHMFYYQPENTDAAIRRFMRKVGLDMLDDILDLREGDRLGSGARRTSWRLEEMKQRMIDQLHQPFEVTDLAVNGHDLMQHFPNLKPGPQLGQVLKYLFEEVLENPELNTQESLFKLASQWFADHSAA